jgi:multicomponent Na+:H+ antiporter subunit E
MPGLRRRTNPRRSGVLKVAMPDTPSSTTAVGSYPRRYRSWLAPAVQALMLMGVWLLLSGHYDAFHISLGVFSVGLVMVLNRGLYRVRLYPGDVHRDLQFGRLFIYVFWLAKEIVVAALQVARYVLDPRMPIDPSFLEFHAELPNASSQVVLANSITLTPGTLTVDITEGVFLVHSLSDASSASLVEGTMPRRVAELFEGDESGEVTGVKIIKSAGEL